MIVAGCDKNNPVGKNGYLDNEDMYAATRLSSAENNLPENHYYLSFCNATGDMGVQILLVGAEGETSLQPGTYTHSGAKGESDITGKYKASASKASLSVKPLAL